jgi:hypothetical protein
VADYPYRWLARNKNVPPPASTKKTITKTACVTRWQFISVVQPPITKWRRDNKIGWKSDIEKYFTRYRGKREPFVTKAAAIADEIYRAAIETAGHLGSPAERGAALRALAYELEARRLSVAPLSDERGLVEPGVLVVQGTDGVWVDTGEAKGSEIDLGGMLRKHEWQYAHSVVFGSDSVTIKTVGA